MTLQTAASGHPVTAKSSHSDDATSNYIWSPWKCYKQLHLVTLMMLQKVISGHPDNDVDAPDGWRCIEEQKLAGLVELGVLHLG